MKLVLAALFAVVAVSATAQASEEFKLGSAMAPINYDKDLGPQYFDTWPGSFCGVKEIRIQMGGKQNAFNKSQYSTIRRVYFAYQTPNQNGPFGALIKMSVALKLGETSGWIKVPDVGLGCLKKVRIYAAGADQNAIHSGNDDYNWTMLSSGLKVFGRN